MRGEGQKQTSFHKKKKINHSLWSKRGKERVIMASRRTMYTRTTVSPPPGVTLLYNFRTCIKISSDLYENQDDDQRVTDETRRTGIEQFDRVLVVGRSKQQFWHGLVVAKRNGILTIHWDHEREIVWNGKARIEENKCVMIPYPYEEGRGRIGPFYERDIVYID